jgi:hypothetical protein
VSFPENPLLKKNGKKTEKNLRSQLVALIFAAERLHNKK